MYRIFSIILIFTITFINYAVSAEEGYEVLKFENGNYLEMNSTPLAKNQGYLIIEFQPEFGFDRIELTRKGGLIPSFTIKNVQSKKKSVFIVKLKEGEYYFSRIKTTGGMTFKPSKDFGFSVTSGVLNYSGEILVSRTAWNSAIFYLKNRLFRFYDEYSKYLEDDYSNVLLHYSGPYVDYSVKELKPCCID